MTSTRTKVIAGGAVAALAAGALAAAQLSSSAANTITVTPNVTSMTTLNYAKVSNGGGTLPQRLANATPCLRVPESKKIRGLRLDYLSYTEPEDVDPSALPGYARLTYRQVSSNSATVPSSGWRPLDLPVAGTPAPVNTGSVLRANGRNVCLSATVPGKFKVQFVNPGESAGTDDDVKSQIVTITVQDAYQATRSALSDDWKPRLTTDPSQIAVGGSATGKLSHGLTQVDARGSSSGVGILQTATAKLISLRFASVDPGDALDQDLNRASVFGADKLGIFKPVTVTGTRDVPAVHRGYKVVRHTGEFAALAGFDANGNGSFASGEQLTRTTGANTTRVLSSLPTPQAIIGAFTAKSAAKGSIYVHVQGTKGTWTIYRNGQKLITGYGSYLSWAKKTVSGTATFTARVTASGYTPAEQSLTVTVK
jgi:hypothetical protein